MIRNSTNHAWLVMVFGLVAATSTPLQTMAMEEVVVTGSWQETKTDYTININVRGTTSQSQIESMIQAEAYRVWESIAENYDQCREVSQIKHAQCDMNVQNTHYEYIQKCGYLGVLPTFTVGPVSFGGGTVEQCRAVGNAWRDASLSTCRYNAIARNSKCRPEEPDGR